MDVMKNITAFPDGNVMHFTWPDYALFFTMLILSTVIGIYFGCFGKKQSSVDDYLLGGKDMNVFPIAMSLIASYISGITILAVPADIYKYGSHYWLMVLFIIVAFQIALRVFIPVFFKLQLTSTYEYLNLRFDDKIRKLSSFLNNLSLFLYLPIVIYVPALALAQATGYNIHFITPLICGVCIFYTTIGGLKAVVWTDALQFCVMIGSIVVVTFLGNSAAGGFSKIWSTAKAGQRLDIDFNFDLYKRDTFWSLLIGSLIGWTTIGVGQGCVQKCIALPTMADVKKAFLIFTAGMVIIMTTSVYTGLIMYTKYVDCDPFTTKQVQQLDQLLPYFVIQVAGEIPGLPGLFIAGVFSAALSSLSACLNCMAGTIYEDFVAGFMRKDISQKAISNILKWIVVIIGVICTALVFAVEHMGSVLPLAMSVGGITGGQLLGLFSMGMLVPMANSKGALYGCLGSVAIMTWIVFGSQYYKIKKIILYEALTLSTEGCTFQTNITVSTANTTDFQPLFLYRISYYYYILIGTCIVFAIGIPVSYFTRDKDATVDRDLISPVMQWALKGGKKQKLSSDYLSVDKAIEMVIKS